MSRGAGGPRWRRSPACCRWSALAPFAGLLPVVLKVSQATLVRGDAPGIEVGPAPGGKCARCWLVTPDVDGETALCGRCSAVVAWRAHAYCCSAPGMGGPWYARAAGAIRARSAGRNAPPAR